MRKKGTSPAGNALPVGEEMDVLFHAVDVPLSFAPEAIEHTLRPGEVREEHFTIRSEGGTGAEGFVSSSKPCVEPLSARFAGSMDEITYRMDAKHFESGDEVQGYFRIFSTEGEYRLPYTLRVEEDQIRSELGSIQSLAHFLNLAKTDFEEACVLFYSPAFAALVAKEDEHAYGIYRGLSARPGNRQNVEEFLIAVLGKQPVEYLPESTHIRTELPSRVLSQLGEEDSAPLGYQLRITRNGWGYTCLQAEAVGDFLSLETEEIDDAGFVGNQFTLRYHIDPLYLHAGKNFGAIRLHGPFASTLIPVEVALREQTATSQLREQEKKRLTLELMRLYERFRHRKLPGREWLEQTRTVIAQLTAIDRSDPVPALYGIHACLTAGETQEARQRLLRINRRLSEHDPRDLEELSLVQYTREEDAPYCYRLYLTALCCGEEEEGLLETVESKIRDKAKRNPGNWRIAWLYLYLSGEWEHLPQEKLNTLRDLYAHGASSPVLYLEAYQVYSANAALLTEDDDFTLQVLWYAARHGILTDEILSRIHTLAERKKTFSEKLYQILAAAYGSTEVHALQVATVESICGLLIKGHQTDSRAFPWYRRGVEAGLQITRLYEYYMLTLPEEYEGQLPREVLMYFAYQPGLPYPKAAALYRYMREHRQEYPELYNQYEQPLLTFTQEQLRQGRLTPDLAVLYDAHLRQHALDAETAEQAVRCVYSCVLRTNRLSLKRVVLLYDQATGEESYPLEDGVCMLPVYGENNHLFFEDGAGNRYAASVPYTLDRLMDVEGLGEFLSQYPIREEAYGIYRLHLEEEELALDDETAARCKALLAGGRLSAPYAHRAMGRLLEYYEEKDALREMEELLEEADPEAYPPAMRGELIRSLILLGKNEKAYEWVRRFDTYEVDDDALFRLSSRLIAAEEIPADPAFSEIVFETFRRGHYDEEMLRYLAEHFTGLSEEMERIRRAMEGFDLSTTRITEKILRQLLYTGARLPEETSLLETHLERGGDIELAAALLARNAHYALTRMEELPRGQFDRIGRFGREGVPLADVCRIAYLRQLADRAGEVTHFEQEVSRLFLDDLLREGIVFPFYRQFMGFVPKLQDYANETLVEYRDKSRLAKRVVYHFAMEENGARGEFATREMTEMYEGWYVTGFTLFFGEQMHYFITDDEEETNIVESGTIGQDARLPEQTEDRFGRVNDIAYLAAMHKDSEALHTLREYDHLSFLVGRLFPAGKQ